jgi:hypothetical protein
VGVAVGDGRRTTEPAGGLRAQVDDELRKLGGA